MKYEKFCKFSKKEATFQKGAKLVDDHLDIIKILKKLQEIDKMKTILLDYRQSQLFKYTEKPSMKETAMLHPIDLNKMLEETKKQAEKDETDRKLLRMIIPSFDSNEQMIVAHKNTPEKQKRSKSR